MQHAIKTEEFTIGSEPYYQRLGREVEIFETAYANRIPVLLKGPTGCGKTRFMQFMAWKLKRPLITVSCHDDLTAADLVGRYLVAGGETVWLDGPLTRAVKAGGFCYLDEIVEARKDTTVVIHPLADDRRILPIEKRGEILAAPPEFLLAVSYNPGYQSVLKDLKQSTRQRFVSLEFDYPPRDKEAQIVAHEGQADMGTALELATLGEKIRNLRGGGLSEGVSTRLLIYAAKLMANGIPARRACTAAISRSLTDDAEMRRALDEIVVSIFP